MKRRQQLVLSAAVAGLIAGGATLITAPSAFAKTEKMDCYNNCKGHGACKTEAHGCKGKNGCAGQGKITKMSAKACEKKGWTTTKPEAPAEKKEGA